MKIIYIFVFLATIGCDYYEPIVQNEPEVIQRPAGDADWYEGWCVNFMSPPMINVDIVVPFEDFELYTFQKDGKQIASLYIGYNPNIDKTIKKKKERINAMEMESYQDEWGKSYIFHSAFDDFTPGPQFFVLYVEDRYASDMEITLSSIAKGSSRTGLPVDREKVDYTEKNTLHPIVIETMEIVSKCNVRYDLGRDDPRNGFDWVGFLRNRWHDLGGDWIPLEGESEYPKVSDHLKR